MQQTTPPFKSSAARDSLPARHDIACFALFNEIICANEVTQYVQALTGSSHGTAAKRVPHLLSQVPWY